MNEKPELRSHGLLGPTIWLVALGAIVYGLMIYQGDYLGQLDRGERGQRAIQKLDQMRRPFLALKRAQVHLIESSDTEAARSRIDAALRDGHRELAEYLEFAAYNEDLRRQVLRLQASYGSWGILESDLASQVARLALRPDDGPAHEERDRLLSMSATAFLDTMDVLGDGEAPIHEDINGGAAATRALLLSTLSFVGYLVAVSFWRERASRLRERLRHAHELKLHKLAHFDSLTGLANRVLLNDRLSVAMAAARRYGQRVGVLYLDLNHFKEVDDSYGHEEGDSVLRQTAARLKANVREMDTVARIGGDEFVVLLTQLAERSDGSAMAGKLQAVLDQPFQVHGKPHPLGASIGMAVFPDDGDDAAHLLAHADAAMYSAKHGQQSAASAGARREPAPPRSPGCAPPGPGRPTD